MPLRGDVSGILNQEEAQGCMSLGWPENSSVFLLELDFLRLNENKTVIIVRR